LKNALFTFFPPDGLKQLDLLPIVGTNDTGSTENRANRKKSLGLDQWFLTWGSRPPRGRQ